MKNKLLKMLVGIGLVMGLAACGGGGDDTATGGTDSAHADAEKVYNQKCSSCHGDNLKGGMGPDLTAVGANYSQDEIANIIQNGQGGMPAGLISGDDLDKVAEWLATKK
jgi:cytochrome c551